MLFYSLAISAESDYSIDRLDWEKRLNQNTSISVENLFGNINVKKAYDDFFVIHAVNQNHNSKKNKAQFLIEEENNHITIKVYFEDGKTIDKERSDVSIIMPQTLSLTIRMNGGDLIAKKINNPIDIVAESAKINLTTKSSFNVFSKSGDIFVKILENAQPESSNIQSYTSNITLEYLFKKPYFEITSGKTVVSNSSALLLSKHLSNRKVLFNNSDSEAQIKLKSDVGTIILIDKNVN